VTKLILKNFGRAGAHPGRYGAVNAIDLISMRRIFIQYLAMGAGLALMFAAIAYLRGAADTSYSLQLATLLILLSWSTLFEASLGSLIFRNFKSVSIQERVIISRKDLLVFYRVLIVGAGFGIAFGLYSDGNSNKTVASSILIGIFFGIRLIEYASRINLVLLGLGLWGQIAVNFFSSLKWLATLSVFIFGCNEFIYLLICHIAIGLVSSVLLIRKRLDFVTSLAAQAPNTFTGMRVRDDLMSVMGVGLGVISFQMDKLVSGVYLNPTDFAQYVFLCTLVFTGPYLLSPVFTLFQQHLVDIRVEDNEKNDWDASVVRLSSLVIAALMMPLLVVINYIRPVNTADYIFSQLGIIALASYLNCLAHISYLRFQVEGRFEMIFYQNLTSLVAAFIAYTLLTKLNSNIYSLILLAAAFGQYVFGVAVSACAVKNWRLFPSFAGLAILSPYLIINLWNEGIGFSEISTAFISITAVVIAGFLTEARILGVSSGRYCTILKNFVGNAR
jgi:hypothetical protein